MITGAQALVDCLLRERIDHVFGIPGTMNPPILDVLRETAAFMAYGVTNLVTRLDAAYNGYVPVISISRAQVAAMTVCNRVRESRLPPRHLQAKKPGLKRGPGFFVSSPKLRGYSSSSPPRSSPLLASSAATSRRTLPWKTSSLVPSSPSFPGKGKGTPEVLPVT
jgi:hypothetical protein